MGKSHGLYLDREGDGDKPERGVLRFHNIDIQKVGMFTVSYFNNSFER